MGDSLESTLNSLMAKYVYDPLGFVKNMFPWGEGVLKGHTGPDKWQTDILNEIGKQAKSGKSVRVAVASGHGIGKTALSAWIIIWFNSTRPSPQIVTTANTKSQLDTKTWRELAKWHKLAHNGHWFEWTAQKFYKKSDPSTWAAFAIPWNKDKAEAFAGTHEENVLMLYDEASLVDDAIWEVTEGAMTTPGAMWVVFGNPTRNTGRFKECFGKFKQRWTRLQIDSRTTKMADNKQIEQWIEDYGEDSDFVRVRVRGVFPRASDMQFISEETVDRAYGKIITPREIQNQPVIMGVDPARYGNDQSIIYVRKGNATLNILKFRGVDTVTLAQRVAHEASNVAVFNGEIEKAQYIFVDGGGVGAGVIDYLDKLKLGPIEVQFGSKSPDKYYLNFRSYIWGLMKKWLEHGGSIPEDDELRSDLIGPEFGFNHRDKLQLERKEDMKRRGLASPDTGDALAMTFAGGLVVANIQEQIINPIGYKQNSGLCIMETSTVKW